MDGETSQLIYYYKHITTSRIMAVNEGAAVAADAYYTYPNLLHELSSLTGGILGQRLGNLLAGLFD